MTCLNYIAFDFETSGLPKKRQVSKVTRENLSNFDTCRAVSLSAARFSSRGRLIKTFDALIQPLDFEVSQSSTTIHGISHEKAMREGRPFPDVFRDFMEFIGPRTKTLIGHNVIFDLNCLQSEMLRHGLPIEQLDDFMFRCTMEMYRERFMSPIKLTLLYKEVFGTDFEGAHNSLADSIACGKVYPYLLGQGERTLKPIPVKKVIIKASDVASAIGCGFKKRPELVAELWKKYLPQTFEGHTADEEAIITLNSLETSKKILAEAENFKSEISTDVQQEIRKLYHELEHSGLLPQDIHRAKDFIRKTLYTNHGTRNEAKTAQTDKMSTKLSIDDNFYTYDICVIEGTLYQIVGKIDRIQRNEDGTRTLVEIKNRAKSFFNSVRDYEDIQCRVYLELLGDIEYCRLVETYEGMSKSYLIQRNYPYWKDEILPKLMNFCEHFHSLLSSS